MMTIEEHKIRTERSYKLLLIFAMISMVMMFAGLTSAMVVSKSRPDWLKNFTMPSAFFVSTAVIVLCSVAMFLAKKSIKANKKQATTVFLWATLGLGVVFIYFQFQGFAQLFENHLYPVGGAGSITISFLYVLVYLHMVHLLGGIISLLIIIYNHFKQKYNASQFIGIELGAMYWHFLDFLWIYLFLFLYFFK
ncbi:cytochrome c oxidase subunit 3 [Flavobacterium aciduliphilum]|uniref:Cytochrome c oxidase subunit 3 n=1 Tax=Flavobacterium aciduliphilum TaxID=1101402 RepID=A0A328YGD6_9FLAO|nr:cytochrome c oxidase subunit 3 [Flavobacterium aciduliphilum]RAR71775.1 cytochrome c oxidase subunit 3 [Flavobacterium aciduliphilum]